MKFKNQGPRAKMTIKDKKVAVESGDVIEVEGKDLQQLSKHFTKIESTKKSKGDD